MAPEDIFRDDQSLDVVLRTIANWDALPLALIIGIFLCLSSAGAYAYVRWYMGQRKALLETIFAFETAVWLIGTAVLGSVFAIKSYGLLPRSIVSRCELNQIRLRTLTAAMDNHLRVHKAYPNGADWLPALKWDGIWPSKYIPHGIITDAAGNTFRIAENQDKIGIRSPGPDGQYDSPDDYYCEKSRSADSQGTWTCYPETAAFAANTECQW